MELLPKKYNPFLLEEVASQTLSVNSVIAELAAKILVSYIENNKICEVNGDFIYMLYRTINGKRALLQRKGREILNNLKKRLGNLALTQERIN